MKKKTCPDDLDVEFLKQLSQIQGIEQEKKVNRYDINRFSVELSRRGDQNGPQADLQQHNSEFIEELYGEQEDGAVDSDHPDLKVVIANGGMRSQQGKLASSSVSAPPKEEWIEISDKAIPMPANIAQVRTTSDPVFASFPSGRKKKTARVQDFGEDYPDDISAKKKSRYDLRPWEQLPVQKTFIPETVEIDTEAVTPSDNEDFDDLRESFQLLRSTERTLVFAIVVDKEDTNILAAIKCAGGTAFGGYAYDRGRDSYIVKCVEFLQVGQVPFSYVMTMKGVGCWQVKVPVPERVLEKHFTPQQKRALDEYRKRFPSSRFEIQFVQMLGCL